LQATIEDLIAEDDNRVRQNCSGGDRFENRQEAGVTWNGVLANCCPAASGRRDRVTVGI
jgi:hypothetical protein